jgi:hypothetical protein
MQSSQQQPSEPKPLRIGAPPPAVPLLEAVSIDEILGHVVPVDFIAALNGFRGAPLRIGGGSS